MQDPANTPAAAPPDPFAYGSILILTFLWGSAFAITGIALQAYAPSEIVAARLVLGAVTLLVGAVLSRQFFVPSLSHLGQITVLGVLGYALPFLGIAWAQQTVASGVAAIYLSTMPLFILALSRLIQKEQVSRRKWAGFTVGLGGLVLLIGPAHVTAFDAQALLPQLALLGSIGCVALSAIFIRRLPPMPTVETTGLALLIGGLCIAPFGLPGFVVTTQSLLASEVAGGDLLPLGAVLCLGVVLSGAGQSLRLATIRKYGPIFYSITGYLIPIWATILGAILLAEEVAPIKLVAFGVIAFGLLLSRSPKPIVPHD